MSVFNGAQFLHQAVASVLNQSFDDFEFLIIDDGSKDQTFQLLERLTDPRVRLIKNAANYGLTKSLNLGLQSANGTYIARMDVDDICHPDRLKLQKYFLDRNPKTALVGTWTEVRDYTNPHLEFQKFPIFSPLLKWQLMFKTPFAHPAVMFRKDAALGVEGYDENFRFAQDFDLWSRLSFHWDIANIPQVLLRRREGPDTISGANRIQQKKIAEKISRRNLQRVWGGEMEIGLFRVLRSSYTGNNFDCSLLNFSESQSAFDALFWRFVKKYNYTDASVRKDLRVELATHSFRLISGTSPRLIPRTKFLFQWFINSKPNILRIFHNLFFHRTLTGTGLSKVFGNNQCPACFSDFI